MHFGKACLVSLFILALTACGGGSSDGNGDEKQACESYKLYVANRSDNNISVVDLCDSVETKTISAGPGVNIWAQDKTHQRIYVSNENSNSISVLDTESDKLIVTLTVGAGPRDIAVDDVRGFVYVTNSGDDTVSVYQTTDHLNYNKAVAQDIPVGDTPHKVVINTGTGKVYVGMANRDVYILDGTNLNAAPVVLDITGGGGNPAIRRMAFNEINKKVYVTRAHSDEDDRVTIINGTAVETTVKVGEGAGALNIDDAGNVFTADHDNNTVTRISVVDNSTVRFNVGQQPRGIRVNSAGTTVYTSTTNDNTVTVVEVSSGSRTAVTVGNTPINIILTEELKRLYIANRGVNNAGNTVSVMDTDSNKVVATVTVGTNPRGMRIVKRD